jgi:hypothetical protein
MKKTVVALTIALGMFLLTSTHATAEWYVGGQAGFVKPNDLKNVEGVGNSNGFSFSDQDLENALGYGVKVGYFFPDDFDWLGLEFEVFTANPHVKQQNVTATTGSSSTSLGELAGSNLRVITPAINLMFRFPGYYVEPYIGGGIGAFWGRLSDDTGSDNDLSPGVNALGGIRFYINEEVALFTEYKYNYTKFKFGDTYKATYSSHGLFGGISFHF